MNKFFSLVFTLLILIGTIAFPVSAASPALSAKYNTNTARTRQFEVEISLKNNPGLNGIMITAEYDTEALSLVSTKNGGLFKTIITKSQSIDVQPYKIMWITTDQNFEEVTEDGVMATYVFKVNDNAPIGKTQLNFSVSDFSDNKNTKQIDFDAVKLTVNIDKNSTSLNGQEVVSGSVDTSASNTSSKNAVTSSPSGGINNITSKNTSSGGSSSSVTTESTASSNNTAQSNSTNSAQSSSLDQAPTKSSSSAQAVNANPQEESKTAPSSRPLILTAIVVVGAGIIGGITLIIKNKRKG